MVGPCTYFSVITFCSVNYIAFVIKGLLRIHNQPLEIHTNEGWSGILGGLSGESAVELEVVAIFRAGHVDQTHDIF